MLNSPSPVNFVHIKRIAPACHEARLKFQNMVLTGGLLQQFFKLSLKFPYRFYKLSIKFLLSSFSFNMFFYMIYSIFFIFIFEFEGAKPKHAENPFTGGR